MKRFIKYLGLFIALATVTVACDSHPSLQQYYVDSLENAEFIAVDIPSSIVSLKDTDASEDVKETLKSIKKINFLGFKLSDTNKDEYDVERLKVKEILKNPKYQELIRIKDGNRAMTVKYLGEEDAIDEVIIYGSDSELGFAVIRVLGDKMDPSKMMLLANEINVDDDNGSFNQIASFMKNMN